MSEREFEYKEVQVGLPTERALDLASVLANLVPLIGGPVASILSGISGGRKEQRILEVIQGVSEDLHDFKSDTAHEYVQTDEFQELLENTLRRASEERNEAKRRIFRNIITFAIRNPCGDYDEQIRFVKITEELSSEHIEVLRALAQPPQSARGFMGSPLQTLGERLPSLTEAQIEQFVNELNDRRITSMTSLRTMMTSHGAADLRHAITPYGKKYLNHVEAE